MHSTATDWQQEIIPMVDPHTGLLNKHSYLYVSRIELARKPHAAERLRSITKNIEWDANTNGAYIKRGSTAHSLAVVLGLDLYDTQTPMVDGVYDRTGLIK